MSDKAFTIGLCSVLVMLLAICWGLEKIGFELKGLREIAESMERA